MYNKRLKVNFAAYVVDRSVQTPHATDKPAQVAKCSDSVETA